jgi:anthranilate phosphoribosyltransferase
MSDLDTLPTLHDFLARIAEGETLSRAEAAGLMNLLLEGDLDHLQTDALLIGMRSRGETVDELSGFVDAMRARMTRIEAPSGAIDVCGTGGDRSGTFNVSTTAALVCAGAGVPVAKHGNRSISSRSGSADVLEALGVRTDLTPEQAEQCLAEVGIAFLFAPTFHAAVRHVGPIRKGLAVRTAFNVLGPLCNPAGVTRQLVGAFSRDAAERMAHVLHQTGATRALTLSARDGLDEVSPAVPTDAFFVDADGVRETTLFPDRFGLDTTPLASIAGGSAEDNAQLLRDVLGGTPSAYLDTTLRNAAWGLWTSGRYDGPEEAFEAARSSVHQGHARSALQRLADATQTLAHA